MLKATAVLTLLAFEFVSASNGPVRFDFTKTSKRSSKSLVSRSVDLPLLNEGQGTLYWVNITVGTPPQSLAVQLDTGSSDLWIPSSAAPICQGPDGRPNCTSGVFDSRKSSTFKFLNHDFNMSYYDPGDTDTGDYISDVLTMGNSKLTGIQMGLANQAADVTGVMGISYESGETICYEEGECNRTVPTVVGQLKDQGYIQRYAYSMWLNDLDSDSGSILFGAIDTAKYHGELVSMPMQADASDLSTNITDLSVALTSVKIRDASGIHDLTTSELPVAALLDSGTFDTELPASLAAAILTGMGAVTLDGEAFVPCRYANANATFLFGFGGGLTIAVPISEMVIDAEFTLDDGAEACYLGINAADDSLGGAIILGDTFLRSAYVVYDLENNQVAMAQTNFNATGSHVVTIPSGTGLPGVSSTATEGVPTAFPTAVGSNAAASTAAIATGTPTFNLGPGILNATGEPHTESGAERTSGVVSVAYLAGTALVLVLCM